MVNRVRARAAKPWIPCLAPFFARQGAGKPGRPGLLSTRRTDHGQRARRGGTASPALFRIHRYSDTWGCYTVETFDLASGLRHRLLEGRRGATLRPRQGTGTAWATRRQLAPARIARPPLLRSATSASGRALQKARVRRELAHPSKRSQQNRGGPGPETPRRRNRERLPNLSPCGGSHMQSPHRHAL